MSNEDQTVANLRKAFEANEDKVPLTAMGQPPSLLQEITRLRVENQRLEGAVTQAARMARSLEKRVEEAQKTINELHTQLRQFRADAQDETDLFRQLGGRAR